MPAKRIGFFCELPVSTVLEIKRQARLQVVPQWQVIDRALNNEPKFRVKGITDLSGGPRRKARVAR